MESQDQRKNEKPVRISGTLDAVATYLEREFEYSASDAAKVAALLWLEQESELAKSEGVPKLIANLKSLDEFGGETPRTQGMVVNSRVFLTLEKAKADAYRQIPAELVEQWLSQDSLRTKAIRMLLRVIKIIAPNTRFVPEGLACVCMRAWNYVKRREHIPFQVEDIMPERESPRDTSSRYVCDLTGTDRRQHIGNAVWECKCHTGENYCTLTPGRAEEMLNILVEKDILKEDNGSYAFL